MDITSEAGSVVLCLVCGQGTEVCDSVSLPRPLGQRATKLKYYKISLQQATACEGQRDGKVCETRGHPRGRFVYACMAILHLWSIFKLSLFWGTLLIHFLTDFSFPNSSKTDSATSEGKRKSTWLAALQFCCKDDMQTTTAREMQLPCRTVLRLC